MRCPPRKEKKPRASAQSQTHACTNTRACACTSIHSHEHMHTCPSFSIAIAVSPLPPCLISSVCFPSQASHAVRSQRGIVLPHMRRDLLHVKFGFRPLLCGGGLSRTLVLRLSAESSLPWQSKLSRRRHLPSLPSRSGFVFLLVLRRSQERLHFARQAVCFRCRGETSHKEPGHREGTG